MNVHMRGDINRGLAQNRERGDRIWECFRGDQEAL